MLSELDPQGLVRPLEAEVGALDLAPRFAVLPEDEALEVMRSEILAKPLEVPRRILDDSLAVLLEKVIVLLRWRFCHLRRTLSRFTAFLFYTSL